MQQELRTAFMALLPVAMMVFASCSSPPEGPGKVVTYEEIAGGAGFGGESVVNSITTNATVVAVDATQRNIVLKYADGSRVTYKAGPEIVDFNQFKVGSRVITMVTENFSVSIVGTGALPDSKKGDTFGATNDLVLGIKPVETVGFTGKVLALDYVQRQATLQLSDGQTKTVKVREAVNLGDFNVGDNVSVLITKAMTIVPEKP